MTNALKCAAATTLLAAALLAVWRDAAADDAGASRQTPSAASAGQARAAGGSAPSAARTDGSAEANGSEARVAERRTEVKIQETKSYWTTLPSGMTAMPEHIPFAKRGLLVITGTVENASSKPIHHVLIAYDLVDAAGKVVFHEEGYNRAAESLIELEGVVVEGDDAAPSAAPLPVVTAPPANAPAIDEIPPGGTDTFRMIIPGEEVPAFDHPNVSVVSAR